MPDPIELLDSFPRSLTGPTPPPGDLRQRGDRRRTRHRVVGTLAAAAVVTAMITPFALQDSDAGSKTPVVVDPDKPTPSAAEWTIDDGFPLRESLPVTEATGAWEWDDIHLSACGQSLPDGIGRQRPDVQPVPVDRRRDGTRYDGGTYEREIMTFDDPATAQAWSDAVVALYEGCPTETVGDVQRIHDVTVKTTERGSTVVVKTHSEVDGARVYGVQLDQVFVVDNAVFFTQFLHENSTQDASREEAEHAKLGVAMIGHTYVSFPTMPDSTVHTSAEVAEKLAGASAEFQAFVGATADTLGPRAECPGAAVGVTVYYVVDDSWAVGGVNECGGYVALWGRTDGEWGQLIGSQEPWDCAELKALAVPDGIAGGCINYTK